MAFNLKNRSFLKEIDFTPRELRYLLQLSEALKIAKYAGTETKRLAGQGDRADLREDLDPHPRRRSRSPPTTRART